MHLSWVMGLFTAFVDASRAYSSVPREEMEPLRTEKSARISDS